MSERLEEVETRLAAIGDLGSVVDAMRALAAVRLQQAMAALGGTRTYAGVVQSAFARALSALPEPRPDGKGLRTARGVIVFAAEHGFVGAFEEPLLERLQAEGPVAAVMVAGSRGAAMLEEHGVRPAWCVPMATQVGGVMAVARRVADRLTTLTAHRLGRVDLLYRTHPHGVALEPLYPAGLPNHVAVPGRAPLFGLPPRELVEHLADEYLFARLAHAAVESFAAENAARLSVMLSAGQNVKDRLEDLSRLANRLRQDLTTQELTELTIGRDD
ncbi:F0F1 ATP synthase subunit gamma [Rhodospirillum centenum]|uniref:ATP synthase F1, gamma subunit n=1 Tax=Rhodospirillum centenum (strain ATCC 51521 / SW) TaxID=414684 RepID=B6IQS7_RHOCS|nr:F0F1 ATP synthase subunit gamma [Rhodospirillum centenum]ACI97813.1 ATP synthase F1, gamma subunit [Rhodospirillum centenum SW]